LQTNIIFHKFIIEFIKYLIKSDMINNNRVIFARAEKKLFLHSKDIPTFFIKYFTFKIIEENVIKKTTS